jgi:hypothetical protein
LPTDARSAGRESQAWAFARDVAFPALAVVVIVAYADIRIPMGLPGHRGLVWLSLLVAVVLATHRCSTVIAVGAASTFATWAVHLPGGVGGSVRYVAAAIVLYAVSSWVGARARRWVVVLAAAPIHLVALADSFGRGYLSAVVAPGMAEKALFHLVFGVVAGLLGWAMASALTGPRRETGCVP